MCHALESAGVATVIATTDADGPDRLPVVLAQVHRYQEANVIFFPRRFTESYKWAAGLGEWLQAHVAQFDAVHVHAVFSHSSLLAGGAARKAGVPYIVRPLGTLDPWSVARKRLQKSLLLRLGVRQMLVGAAAMHYTSDEEMRLAETVVAGLPEGRVVPLGIGDDLFEEVTTDRDERPSIVTLSRLDAKKGVDLLIAAFHEACGRGPYDEWRLIIAGDGEPAYVSRLKDLARSGVAGSRISFAGWIGTAEKTALLRQAALFALPSHQENFGISIVEAMACGVPVLVTPGVNLGAQIVSSGAGWLMARHPSAIGRALETSMGDAAERGRRGQAGRRFARQYRWAVVAERLDELYRAVTAARDTPAPRPVRSVREPAAH
jgi:glycosyltransferase involved in cell wall biosynthesis